MLNEAQLKAIEEAVPKGFSFDQLKQYNHHAVLNKLGIRLKDASESYARVRALVPFVKAELKTHEYMAIGDAYFRRRGVKVPRPINARNLPYSEKETKLVDTLKKFNDTLPKRGLEKYRWLLKELEEEIVEDDLIFNLVLGSEVLELERNMMRSESIKHRLCRNRLQAIVDEIRERKNEFKRLTDIIGSAINKAEAERLRREPGPSDH
ncbi:hypothetical protein PsorP6_007885 [Peronosclerospora sorghi]|uniref:Uncharacterized protein n=1 Tax=Peronosclerospora sorghi TaxID=230839 RepID=A0ACC0WAH1_9STRA|nr:hypothetical protein PsorP6_007885 [Peronosclerospora sorghi]